MSLRQLCTLFFQDEIKNIQPETPDLGWQAQVIEQQQYEIQYLKERVETLVRENRNLKDELDETFGGFLIT